MQKLAFLRIIPVPEEPKQEIKKEEED